MSWLACRTFERTCFAILLKARWRKIERSSGKAPSPDQAQRASVTAAAQQPAFFQSLSWARPMEDQSCLAFENGDEDIEGIKHFTASETTASFLRHHFATPLANSSTHHGVPSTTQGEVRRTQCGHYGILSLGLDKVLRSRMSNHVRSRDREITSRSLTSKDNLDAVRLALSFLGNFDAQWSCARRAVILQRLNPRIADMVDEDRLYITKRTPV